MKIRSITLFYHPSYEQASPLAGLAENINGIKNAVEEIGWEVQTTRLATVPFGIYVRPAEAADRLHALEIEGTKLGFDYISAGPARISRPDEYQVIPEILSATENVFLTGMMTEKQRGISPMAVRACAEVITQAARITQDGFANLRFCAMSGVRPFTPFFPAAYSYGTQPSFALAVECADAAVEAFKNADDINNGRKALLTALDTAAEELYAEIRDQNLIWTLPFKGFDFSLAPFPEDWCSLAGAIENLAGVPIGTMGSLTAAAILAETLDRGSWRRVGYNGLMLPVLEDSILADRSIEGTYSIKDLLMFSAVCGTGLDTVPLPGDVSVEAIQALLTDVAALSLRLNKPLTARLMPVPNMQASEKTNFDFDFFKNGKVLDFPAVGLGKLLTEPEWIKIQSRAR